MLRKTDEQRLQQILRGAFAGPPTPLKDIPKRNAESRAKGGLKMRVPANGTKKRQRS
jgi:hypothetical protein